MGKERRVRIVSRKRSEPDLKKLARAVIELAKQMAAEERSSAVRSKAEQKR